MVKNIGKRVMASTDIKLEILNIQIVSDFVIFDFLASAKVRKQGDSTKLRYNWTLELGLYINAQNYIEK